jgi:hypothetical protein
MKRQKERLINDSVAEALLGLFQKVKDSPRHISIRGEQLLDEVHMLCTSFYKDRRPEARLQEYARQVEQDMGWHYAVELVMSMAYNVMRLKNTKSRKIEHLLANMEQNYRHCCYWQHFLQLENVYANYPSNTRVLLTGVLNGIDRQHHLPIMVNINIENNFSGNIDSLTINGQ